ncbi:O-antigen ligase family protein [Virgibacillus sp. LDC-1]|uniref:O-antigen ligase family protein n=1 Tax=Virgibacillus sp. LDC-1 TaxID=3039856 RepID=UPI0024DEF9CA|nr:O-antigen ligase family protein [Virgibacillus sp. LDC-1]
MHLLQHTKWRKRLEYSFIYFIALQPFLDIAAFIHLPISEIARIGIMVAGFWYILLLPPGKWKKIFISYFLLVISFMVVHLIVTLGWKHPFSVGEEVIHIVKSMFFVELLVVFILVFNKWHVQLKKNRTIERLVFFNMATIGGIMLVATITGTGKKTYDALAKAGHSGWFFSGNELSTIVAMGFSMMLLYFWTEQSFNNKIYQLPFIVLVIASMLEIGTKVSFGAVVVILGIALLLAIIGYPKHRERWKHAAILATLFMMTIIAVPYAAIGNNLNFFFGETNSQQEEQKDTPEDEPEQVPELLSGRSEFLDELQMQFSEAPLLQKLFGMGYGGNYEQEPKLAEMDMLDWFFGFGIVGSLLLFLPLLSIGILLLRHLLLCKWNLPIIFAALATCLGLGSSFVAGHVLSSPAASIYLIVVISFLWMHVNPPTLNR